MNQPHHNQLEHKGKKYGYFVLNGEWTGSIRSESNPFKTPYLKPGSKTFNEIAALIRSALANL